MTSYEEELAAYVSILRTHQLHARYPVLLRRDGLGEGVLRWKRHAGIGLLSVAIRQSALDGGSARRLASIRLHQYLLCGLYDAGYAMRHGLVTDPAFCVDTRRHGARAGRYRRRQTAGVFLHTAGGGFRGCVERLFRRAFGIATRLGQRDAHTRRGPPAPSHRARTLWQRALPRLAGIRRAVGERGARVVVPARQSDVAFLPDPCGDCGGVSDDGLTRHRPGIWRVRAGEPCGSRGRDAFIARLGMPTMYAPLAPIVVEPRDDYWNAAVNVQGAFWPNLTARDDLYRHAAHFQRAEEVLELPASALRQALVAMLKHPLVTEPRAFMPKPGDGATAWTSDPDGLLLTWRRRSARARRYMSRGDACDAVTR